MPGPGGRKYVVGVENQDEKDLVGLEPEIGSSYQGGMVLGSVLRLGNDHVCILDPGWKGIGWFLDVKD